MLFWFISCTLFSSKPTNSGCVNDADCTIGMSCIAEICKEVECSTSFDCELQKYCTEENRCAEGCTRDEDCLPGFSCSEGTCSAYECREAALDCLLGEQCVNGHCQLVEPSPCTPCTYQDWYHGLGEERECVIVSFDRTIPCDWREDQGCPDTMSCYPADGMGLVEEGVCIYSYAFFRCETESDCPRGFSCAQDIYANNSEINVCWGDCRLYLEQGWLE